MQKSHGNIQLSSYDDIFGGASSKDKEAESIGTEQVKDIPLSELHPFKNHPFKVLDDEEMAKTAESIKEYGYSLRQLCDREMKVDMRLCQATEDVMLRKLLEKKHCPVS